VDRPESRCIARTDLPLASTYSMEYTSVRDGVRLALNGQVPTRILTSPLSRCSQLAWDLSNDPGLAFAFQGRRAERDDRLLEFNYGSWEGRRWDDIDTGKLNYWMENWTAARAGDELADGESLQDMLFRVTSLCHELAQAMGGDRADSTAAPAAGCTWDTTALLVAHAGVIRCLHHLLRRVPVGEAFAMDIPYGSVTEFELSGATFTLH